MGIGCDRTWSSRSNGIKARPVCTGCGRWTPQLLRPALAPRCLHELWPMDPFSGLKSAGLTNRLAESWSRDSRRVSWSDIEYSQCGRIDGVGEESCHEQIEYTYNLAFVCSKASWWHKNPAVNKSNTVQSAVAKESSVGGRRTLL